MVIAVEGMDGAGKSTIAKFLAQKYNLILIDKPVKYIYGKDSENRTSKIEEILENIYNYDDPIIKTWFFALGNIMAVRNFKNKNIVIDRHFVSNYFWNSDFECQIIYDTLFKLIGKPDLTILLYAEVNTRIDRIKLKDDKDPDLLDMDVYKNDYEKMLKFIEKNSLNYYFIDTTKLSLYETEKVVSKKVEKLLQECSVV